MNSFKFAIRAAGIPALMFALTACDGTPTTTTTNESSDLRSGVVYSEAFADSGRFTITKTALGEYNYNVEARIGSKAEAMMTASATEPTLAGVYQALHEGKTETPAIVSEVSGVLESRKPAVWENDRVAPAPLALSKAASESAFKTGYCKDIPDGPYVWKVVTCVWKPGNNQTTTGGVYGNGFVNDRVYAWNNTAYLAKLKLWNTNFTGSPNTWNPSLNPYWVTWFQWGGTYSNANAVISLPSGYFGEIGLSVHSVYSR